MESMKYMSMLVSTRCPLKYTWKIGIEFIYASATNLLLNNSKFRLNSDTQNKANGVHKQRLCANKAYSEYYLQNYLGAVCFRQLGMNVHEALYRGYMLRCRNRNHG